MQTFTTTATYTRLEALEDQFDHFLRFGGIGEGTISTVRKGVQEKKIHSVGLYACDGGGLRVLEISLQVDWAAHGRLIIQQPMISRQLSGWDGTMSPEVKVAGRRFSEVAKTIKAKPQCWVAWQRAEWARENGFSGTVPRWAGQIDERNDSLLDLPEATVFIRTASSQ